MKILPLFLTLFVSAVSNAEQKAEPQTFSPEGLVEHLNNDEIEEVKHIYQEVMKKDFNLMFLSRDYSQSRYGAKKVFEKDGLIILEGQPWIREGDFLIEMRNGADSTIKLHKKTMRIVYFQGNIIRTSFPIWKKQNKSEQATPRKPSD